MNWIGVLFVSPIWGALSTQLFLQAWLAVANFAINLIGFVLGRVERSTTAMAMGVALVGAILYSVLLRAGFWLLIDVLHFGYTNAENTVYWIFAIFSGLFIIVQLPAKLRKSWHNAIVPESLEEDIMKRKLNLDPDHE